MKMYRPTVTPPTEAEIKAERIKAGFRQMLADQTHSHFVTLNFHRPYSSASTTQKLRLWTINVLTRLFSTAEFAGVSPDAVFRFTAFAEKTWSQNPHLHLLVYVEPSRLNYFDKIAATMWKTVVPSGTADVQRIAKTPEDLERVINYATKETHLAASNAAFLTSNMLDLPEMCRPLRKPKKQKGKKQGHCPQGKQRQTPSLPPSLLVLSRMPAANSCAEANH